MCALTKLVCKTRNTVAKHDEQKYVKHCEYLRKGMQPYPDFTLFQVYFVNFYFIGMPHLASKEDRCHKMCLGSNKN